MQQAAHQNLVRKQIMLSNSNIKKLKEISNDKGVSVAEVVRLAVENYDPSEGSLAEKELMAIVSQRLKEAIKDTSRVRRKVNKTIKAMEQR